MEKSLENLRTLDHPYGGVIVVVNYHPFGETDPTKAVSQPFAVLLPPLSIEPSPPKSREDFFAPDKDYIAQIRQGTPFAFPNVTNRVA